MSLWTLRIGSSQHRGKHCLSDPPVLVRALLTSYIILAGPVRHLSLKQRLPFRPGQMQVLWYLSESLQSKMRSLSTWECHFCDWRQQSDLRFQNLSLYRPDSIETPPELYWLQCLFLFFSTEFYGSGFPSLLDMRCCGLPAPKTTPGPEGSYLAFRQSWQTLPTIWLGACSTDFLKQRNQNKETWKCSGQTLQVRFT